MKIETDRLVIRSMQEDDLEPITDLWTDPEVTYFMGGARNREELINTLTEDLAAASPPIFDIWPVVEKESGTVIGHCGVIDKDIEGKTEYEIVYVFAKTSWGKGYATEAGRALRHYAFEQLGLKRVVALIDLENSKSERVATKIGLKHQKDTIRPNGKRMKIYALDAHQNDS